MAAWRRQQEAGKECRAVPGAAVSFWQEAGEGAGHPSGAANLGKSGHPDRTCLPVPGFVLPGTERRRSLKRERTGEQTPPPLEKARWGTGGTRRERAGVKRLTRSAGVRRSGGEGLQQQREMRGKTAVCESCSPSLSGRKLQVHTAAYLKQKTLNYSINKLR